MGRVVENAKKDVVLLNTDDVIKDEELKAKINKLDDKVQQMLLWSTLCAVWSYLVLIVVIARIYSTLNGKHVILLVCSLLLMYVFIGALIYFVWRSMTLKKLPVFITTKSYLIYQVDKLLHQRKLISCYLLEYALILAISSIYFFTGIKNGLPQLLKLTAPVSLVTYVVGFYFIASFTRQMKKLELMKAQFDQLLVSKLGRN